MRRIVRGGRPSWRAPEGMFPRPELWLCATLVLGMLLTEVWQTSRMALLCLGLDQARSASAHAEARLDYLRAAAERRCTRGELVPLAARLGLAPADAKQIVMLPSEYLADDRSTPGNDASSPVLAWAERVSGALVPEATARGRVAR